MTFRHVNYIRHLPVLNFIIKEFKTKELLKEISRNNQQRSYVSDERKIVLSREPSITEQ